MAIARLIKVLFLFALFLWPLTGTAQNTPPVKKAAAEKVFHASDFTLDNGLRVIIIPNHRAPVATHMIWYKVGAADEPPGKSGLAHFLEHLMFKGSATISGKTLAPGEFSEIVRGLGGQDNAFTGKDYTAYFQSISTEYLETVMDMEAGRMRSMDPPPQELLSERKVIIEERRQRTENDPRGLFREKMTAALFLEHPYGVPVIGWPEEMAELDAKDVQSFYNQYYRPNNAILVVSGAITDKELKILAEKTYGKISAGPVPERPRAATVPDDFIDNSGQVVMTHKAIREPLVQIAFRVPSYHQNPEEALALQVLEDIMGGGPTARLYKSLVVEQKLAASAGLYYDSAALDDAAFWIYAVPLPDIWPEKLQNAIKKELKKLIENGVTTEELSDAKTRLQNKAIYARDSLRGPAMIFGRALTTGSEIEDVEYWPHKISQVTAGDIQAAAEKYLDTTKQEKGRFVVGRLLPHISESHPSENAEGPQ